MRDDSSIHIYDQLFIVNSIEKAIEDGSDHLMLPFTISGKSKDVNVRAIITRSALIVGIEGNLVIHRRVFIISVKAGSLSSLLTLVFERGQSGNTLIPSGSTTTFGIRICHSDRSSWEGYPVGSHDGTSSGVMGYLLWRLIADRQSSSTWG